MPMRKRVPTVVALAVVAGTLLLGALAAPAQAALKHLDGTVLSKDGGEMSFRVKAENGNRVRFLVSAVTEFERIADFDALHKGMAIEVDYVKTPTGLVAKQVEPQGGNGDGGGGDDHGGGSDDGPSHD